MPWCSSHLFGACHIHHNMYTYNCACTLLPFIQQWLCNKFPLHTSENPAFCHESVGRQTNRLSWNYWIMTTLQLNQSSNTEHARFKNCRLRHIIHTSSESFNQKLRKPMTQSRLRCRTSTMYTPSDHPQLCGPNPTSLWPTPTIRHGGYPSLLGTKAILLGWQLGTEAILFSVILPRSFPTILPRIVCSYFLPFALSNIRLSREGTWRGDTSAILNCGSMSLSSISKKLRDSNKPQER